MEYSCRRCGIDTGGFVGHTCNVITYPAHHTSPEKEYGQPEHKGNGDTIGSLKKLAEVMQEEVSQEKEPSYIDQVVEEFRETFLQSSDAMWSEWLLSYRDKLSPLDKLRTFETFLREKLEQQELAYLRRLEAAIVHHQETGKTAERQRIREIVEGYRVAVFNRDVHGEYRLGVNDVVETLLSRLSEDTNGQTAQ